MSDPIFAAVAVALATGAANGLTEAGKAAFATLARLVKRKLAADDEARDALDRACRYPTDEAGRQALAVKIGNAADGDREFAAELHRLWADVEGGRIEIGNASVRNTVVGGVDGTVVQARDIHGGISFGRV